MPVLAAIAAAGRVVDVLVNNAGFGIPQSYLGVPWARQRDFLMTLIVSPCGFAYAVLPGMIERGGGAIINVGSLAAFSPGVAGNSLYPGAKGLAVTFSQALDAEYRAKGLKVTAVCPGFTKTDFGAAAGVQAIMDEAPRFFWQSAETVVETAIAANERGKVVVIPGWHNRLSVFLMRALPGSLVRAIIGAGAKNYHLGDSGRGQSLRHHHRRQRRGWRYAGSEARAHGQEDPDPGTGRAPAPRGGQLGPQDGLHRPQVPH